jgi:hypothetical protein
MKWKKGMLIEATEKKDVTNFLKWILDSRGSRVRISVRQKFKHWQQLFPKHAGRKWLDAWRQEVNHVCINRA